MLASSRAIALVSVIAGDDAPLHLLPRLSSTQAGAARTELLSLSGPRRAAALARTSLELFRPPAQGPGPVPLPHCLAVAVRRNRPLSDKPGPVPAWVSEAVSALEPLGLRTLARAAAGRDPSTLAELARRVSGPDVERFVRDLQQPTGFEVASRGRRIVALADSDRAAPATPRSVGVCRLAWALGGDLDACAATRSLLTDEEAARLEHLARAAWLLADDRAELEQALIVADLGEVGR